MDNILIDYPVIVSVCYYITFLVIGHVLRSLVEQFVDAKYQRFLLEMVTTFQVLGCSLENGQIRMKYGLMGFTVAIYFLCTWYSLTLGSTSANPCSRVSDYMHGRVTARDTTLLIFSQIAGAMLSYRAATTIWNFGLTDGHRYRLKVACMTDLSASLPVGLALESFGILFIYLLNLKSFTSFHSAETNIKCVMECLLTAAGKLVSPQIDFATVSWSLHKLISPQ